MALNVTLHSTKRVPDRHTAIRNSWSECQFYPCSLTLPYWIADPCVEPNVLGTFGLQDLINDGPDCQNDGRAVNRALRLLDRAPDYGNGCLKRMSGDTCRRLVSSFNHFSKSDSRAPH